jgi:hypothetical protein
MVMAQQKPVKPNIKAAIDNLDLLCPITSSIPWIANGEYTS